MIATDKYVGTYRVFQAINLDGTLSKNEDDTYLKCKYNTQVYRYNKDTLAILFVANRTVKNMLPVLKKAGVHLRLHTKGDYESTYLFPEEELEKLAKIMKPITKGKNIKPNSVRTQRILAKELNRY